MTPRRRALVAPVWAAAAIAPAGAVPVPGAAAAAGSAGGGIVWADAGEGVEDGWLDVPLDYADPDAGTVQLRVARHPAAVPDARIGSLIVNPGGPGVGGTLLARLPDMTFSQELIDRFDIVAWDPRGTGESTPAIDCIDDWDAQFVDLDITPESDDARQALADRASAFAEACVAASGALLDHVGTNDSARDVDALRRALGEETVSYLGFSYGAELGAVWATMFPDTARAVVLDSASDPAAALPERTRQSAAAFEAQLTRFLEWCGADDTCPFHNDGEPAAAFDELLARIDESPLPTSADRPPLNLALFAEAARTALYAEGFWPQFADALAAAGAGDGAGLLMLYDGAYERQPDGTWPDAMEAMRVITCMDWGERPTIEESDASAAAIHAAGPRVEPGTAGPYPCNFFPAPSEPRAPATGAGAGPIVVCGVTGDMATPLEGSRAMAEALEDGRLVVVEGEEHICYGLSECADRLVHAYLVDLDAPPDETACRP